jgi:transposase
MQELKTMSDQELTRFEVLQRIVNRQMTQTQAGQVLGLSRRQIYRLLQAIQEVGAAGLISKRRGKPSNHQLAPGLAEKAIALIKARYADFGPTLACEKLRERHEVYVSVETVRKLMMTAGLWVPRAWRDTPVHQPRTRRPCLGELVQIDGCEHAWFEKRAPVCTLLVYVDDATSRILIARLVGSESTTSYMETTREYVERYGKPLAFYSDRHSVFNVNRRDSLTGEGITQFCRALQQLGIELICATSSQAKGRVERAHLTLQDRLVKELRLQGISTIEGANRFLGPFIDDYNYRFGKEARNPLDAHRPLGQRERLDDIFSVQEKRQLSRNLTFRHDNTVYAIEPNAENLKLKNKTVTVLTQLDGTMRVRYRNRELRFVKDSSRPSRKAPPKHASHKDLTEIINRLFPDPERVIDLVIEGDLPECEHDTAHPLSVSG